MSTSRNPLLLPCAGDTCFLWLCVLKNAHYFGTYHVMGTFRHLAKKAKPSHSHPAAVRVLNGQAYDEIRKKRKTFEIHLTPGLFSTRRITPSALMAVVARKAPASGPYNAVFHFSRQQKDELTEKLEKARQKMPNPKGGWYIMFTNSNRAATEARVRKIVPKGLVKSSVIDAALSALS